MTSCCMWQNSSPEWLLLQQYPKIGWGKSFKQISGGSLRALLTPINYAVVPQLSFCYCHKPPYQPKINIPILLLINQNVLICIDLIWGFSISGLFSELYYHASQLRQYTYASVWIAIYPIGRYKTREKINFPQFYVIISN